MLGNILGDKPNIYERNWSNFILDYFSVDYEDFLKIDDLNADNSSKMFLGKINMLSDTYPPHKRIINTNWNLSLWMTLGLQLSVSIKNKLLTNFINKKDPLLKQEFHTKYKKYTTLLSTLMNKSKHTYYDKFLKETRIILRIHGKESNPLFP